MAVNIFVPEAVSVTETRQGIAGFFVTKAWLAFFNQMADLMRRISATGTRGGVVVTDDDGLAQVVLNEMDTPEFDAGDFTADTGSWDVEDADVVTYAYSILGRMMTVAFTVVETSVSGGPTVLSILIPQDRVSAKEISNPVIVSDNGDPYEVAMATVTASGTTIDIELLDGSAFADATDTTEIRGEITFEMEPEA